VQGQLSFAVPELGQCPVTARVAVGASSAGNRPIRRGWTWDGGELDGDVAARHPGDEAAVRQRGVRRDRDDHAGAHVVADMLACREELVVKDDLIAQRKGEPGLRTLFAVTGENGLNTTQK
jgi:hypothetical protein